MKKVFFTLLILFLTVTITFSQTANNSTTFNFDLEVIENNKPLGWTYFPSTNNDISLDSLTVKNGSYAVCIEQKEGGVIYSGLTFIIPNSYKGKYITLSGYIKTENVTDGHAALWMRIDPMVAFNAMGENGVKATTDWTKYEIKLLLQPEKTEQIAFGCILTGKGKMWIDNFKVTIDGKDINNLKPFERKYFPAEKDKEFENGSQITSISVDKTQIENLKDIGLIWGFLKYYHPNIAKGNFNWDYELFRILPKINNSKNQKDRDELLVKWIEGLGTFSKGKISNPKSSEIKIIPDIDWIEQSHFSPELVSILRDVKNAKRPKEHFYIGLNPGKENPVFKNENPYKTMIYPDAGFRILSLFRYWNIIQYYFPYRNLIEEDWKNVLQEFIPKFINAQDETEYTLVVLELIGRIHDTHANIWGGNKVLFNYFGVNYAPVKITFIEEKPLVVSFFDAQKGKESGLEIGDIITKVNNIPVDTIIERSLKYTPASNYPTKLRDIAPNLLRTNDSILSIEFIRNDSIYKTRIKTFSSSEINIYRNNVENDTCFRWIHNDIAYLNNGTCKKKYLPLLWKSIQNSKGLIIDIRNYPSEFIIHNLSKYLMPSPIPFVKFSTGSINYPGLFTYTSTFKAGKKKKAYYKGKIVILVNEITQSSAEFHAMSYRVHPKAVVIGSTTAGADGNVSQFYLPGGISTMISGIGVYYPDGGETQRIGIVPDIVVKPTIKGIKESRDELIEKAIDIINK